MSLRREGAPLWYKDAVIYELHVRAFRDARGDGFGDFRGLTQKLDYLKDLGVTALWLLPFFPSPLRDDGYDTSDYLDVLPDYGTLADFREFLREAHGRDLRVITEMVVNHTSDQHPWFQKARRAKPGSRARDFYVWSDSAERFPDARIIFKDFERSNWTWDPVAKAHYWHRFYSHQPDLNYDNPEVHREIMRAMDFWFEMGVDGLRLDAVPYLYERDGTNCENLPETHEFLRKLRRHVDARYPDRMLLAEANQWPEDAVAYFGKGDECHMAFHFPLMPRLFMGLHQEDRFPILDILEQTPAIPENAQWAIFLRNHDELTLEMVTDEERDYMWRVYAREERARINLGIRRRLAPLLGNSRRRIELMNALLFSLPGTPVLYYGDEIGMGDNIHLGDRNSVRTPMQWSSDRNAGFSSANPQRLYLPVVIDPEYHYEALNVEAQQANTSSLLWWMKRLIALRKRHEAFSRGTIEFLRPANRRILAFTRTYRGERILVVANLSRYAQYAELEIPEGRGVTPVELFGGTEFPRITAKPYLLTLGPHAFFWFRLVDPAPITVAPSAEEPPIEVAGDWDEVFDAPVRAALEQRLATYLPERPWFRGRARGIRVARILDLLNWRPNGFDARLAMVQCEFPEGGPETYVVPLAFVSAREAERFELKRPGMIVTRLRAGEKEGLLYDPSSTTQFAVSLLKAMEDRRRIRGERGYLKVKIEPAFHSVRGDGPLVARPPRDEVSKTSIVYGDRLFLTMSHLVDEGVSPEVELGRLLNESIPEGHVPPLAASFEYIVDSYAPRSLAVVHGYVKNEGNAWNYAVDGLGRYIDALMTGEFTVADLEAGLGARDEELAASLIESARQLGVRTAELHLALSSDAANPALSPEPFTSHYQRSLFQTLRALTHRVFRLIENVRANLDAATRDSAERLLAREQEVIKRFQEIVGRRLTAQRIRHHGTLHLGHVLYTGRDFVIRNFEGDPDRPWSERRLKRSPIRDVASLIRSFHYAGYAALREEVAPGLVSAEHEALLRRRLRGLRDTVVRTYRDAYCEKAGVALFMPRSEEEFEFLARIFLLERALSELGAELQHRLDWVEVPLAGIAAILDEGKRT